MASLLWRAIKAPLNGEPFMASHISKDILKVEPRLEVGLHPIDQHILTSLNKNFHEIGKINQCGNYPHWSIRGINNCYNYVLPFFYKYLFLTKKKSRDYFL
jgi:hypothetical protein